MVCLLTATASAQTASSPSTSAQGSQPPPVLEMGANYSYNTLETSANGESIQNGGSIHGVYFFHRTDQVGGAEFGVSGEFAGSGSGSGRLYTYLVGPRWGVWRRGAFFYGGLSAGGARIDVTGVNAAGAPVIFTQSGFAFDFATAGVELRLGKHCLIKLLEVENLLLQVPNPATGINHWHGAERTSAGLVFRFGQR